VKLQVKNIGGFIIMRFEVTFATKSGNEIVGTFNMQNKDVLKAFIRDQDELYVDQGDREIVLPVANIDLYAIKVVY
jgi:hypothetical protein